MPRTDLPLPVTPYALALAHAHAHAHARASIPDIFTTLSGRPMSTARTLGRGLMAEANVIPEASVQWRKEIDSTDIDGGWGVSEACCLPRAWPTAYGNGGTAGAFGVSCIVRGAGRGSVCVKDQGVVWACAHYRALGAVHVRRGRGAQCACVFE